MSQCLAYSAAAGGQKVLMIDCDLRHPSLSKHFGLSEGPGLTDLLTGDAPAEQVFHKEIFPNLTVMPGGTITRHPPDVLGSEELRILLQEVRQHYDLVVLDAPPVTPVIDTILLSKLADKVIFVVQWRMTRRDIVTRAIAMLDDSRRKISGIALNNVQTRRASSYSPTYGYYHKRYRKYYVQ